MSDYRIEKDTMGDVRVPADALWGAQTQRAIENFPVSGIRFSRRFIRALGLVKQAAAEANRELGLLKPDIAGLIAQAASEIADGSYDDHFPLDVFQTGSGTSMNMNANEVIANVANERSGGGRGAKEPVHPNNHPNLCQSSNDVIPAVIHIAALDAITNDLGPALEQLERSFRTKSQEFASVVKTGRTHLMDAVPVTLGQEFGGYARQVELGRDRLNDVLPRLGELALGGTAVGTGLNAHPDFARKAIERIATRTGLGLREAADHFEAQGAQDAAVEASGTLKTVAASLCKMANDIRWLGSGPDAGLAEVRLPDLQPGSSIMPGKVNPVIPEVVIQVAAQVFGCDTSITFGGATGDLELNVRLPMIAHNLLLQIAILASAAKLFAERCVDGIEANVDRCRELVEATTSVVTALNPVIGYDRAAALFKEAKRTGRSVRELAMESNVLPPDELERALDVLHMTKGGFVASGGSGG